MQDVSDLKVSVNHLVPRSCQRPSGQNVLHQMLNYCYVCCSKMNFAVHYRYLPLVYVNCTCSDRISMACTLLNIICSTQWGNTSDAYKVIKKTYVTLVQTTHVKPHNYIWWLAYSGVREYTAHTRHSIPGCKRLHKHSYKGITWCHQSTLWSTGQWTTRCQEPFGGAALGSASQALHRSENNRPM